MDDIDQELSKNLIWTLNNDISELDLTFCYDLCCFGKVKTLELKNDGKNISVNEENKKEYVKLLSYAKMTTEIKLQTEAIMEGFHEIFPKDLLFLIDWAEVGLKFSGSSIIDGLFLFKISKYLFFYLFLQLKI